MSNANDAPPDVGTGQRGDLLASGAGDDVLVGGGDDGLLYGDGGIVGAAAWSIASIAETDTNGVTHYHKQLTGAVVQPSA